MQTIEQHRHHDYERYEANRRFEEMTDIAERIGYPIDTTVRYEIRNGLAYACSDTVDRPFHNQTYQAWQRGKQSFTGDQAFEVERLRLEHQEALMVDALGAGTLPGNVMIKLSKVPDAVVEQRTSIKGYRRDLQRSFVRIYFRDPEGVTCRLFSLDHNDALGMRRVGELLGIATDRPSEHVLADVALLHVEAAADEFVEALKSQAIDIYDAAIYEQAAQPTHAGSRYVDHVDAMRAVSDQPRLFEEHMDAIGAIMSRAGYADDYESQLESQREHMAAAVALATQGHEVASVGSADVASEAKSGDYGRECATASGMNQAQNGQMENVWRHGECQVCFAKTSVGSCMVCANCAAADDRGEDLLKLREHNLRSRHMRMAAAAALEQAEQKPVPSLQTTLSERYGQKVRLQKIITIGGQDTLVLDSNDEVIDRL